MVISDLLPPSLLRDRLVALAELYHRADEAVAAFCAASGLACPQGCGTCCEGFIPDVLPLEAAAVATFLADRDKAAYWSLAVGGEYPDPGRASPPQQGLSPDGGLQTPARQGCPLYAPDTPWHCTVYEARPLVCRLFAFSAVRNKRGQSSFSLCKLMPSFTEGRSAFGASIKESFGAEPPVMADYGAEILALDPHSSGDRAPLPEALSDALSRVLFLVGVKALENQDDPRDDDPDLQPPLPRAS